MSHANGDGANRPLKIGASYFLLLAVTSRRDLFQYGDLQAGQKRGSFQHYAEPTRCRIARIYSPQRSFLSLPWVQYIIRNKAHNEREDQKALAIAAKSKLTKRGDNWIVPSQTGSGKYTVDSELQHCTCLDYELRKLKCNHIFAVEYTIECEQRITETTDGETSTTTVPRL